ncbi:MAG: hypothetical protein ABI791_03995 [Acidobacteriota bacterium]
MVDPPYKSANDLRWNSLHLKASEVRVAAAFCMLRQNGIEPVLIKGWAVGRLYPIDRPRLSVDVDLAVAPDEFQKASIIRNNGSDPSVLVDLHKGFRHFDPRPWKETFRSSILIPAEGAEIRVPSPEDHLRILCAHWLNDGGVDRKRLWDIYYSVEKRPESFDWDRCLNAAGPERRSWVVYTIAMAHEYLGLPIDDLPMRDELRNFPEWMRETVEKEWASGVRLRDLRTCLGDWKLLRNQIRKRIPPNPIQATIEMQKSLDDPRRCYFQARTVFRRAVYSASKMRYRFSK